MTVEHFFNNKTVGLEFIKHLTTTELAELYSSADIDISCPIDNSEYFDEIILSKDKGKLLVLAKYGKLDDYSSPERRRIAVNKIIKTSKGHKNALLGNLRIDWGESFRKEDVFNELLIDVITNENDNSIFTILENPRTDRKLLAEAIRGEGKFKKISTTRKLQIICNIGKKNIEFEWNGIRDFPYNREMYFDDPYRAIYGFIKKYIKTASKKDFADFIDNFNDGFLRFAENDEVKLESDDWCDKKDKAEFYYGYLQKKSFANFIQWIDDITADINLEKFRNNDFKDKYQIELVKFTLTSMLKFYKQKDYDFEETFKKLFISRKDNANQILKAFCYAIEFMNIEINTKVKNDNYKLWKFTRDLDKNIEKLVGVLFVCSIHNFTEDESDYKQFFQAVIDMKENGSDALIELLSFSNEWDYYGHREDAGIYHNEKFNFNPYDIFPEITLKSKIFGSIFMAIKGKFK
jgi:hypothetical protein